MLSVALATEDELSEAVGRRMLLDSYPHIAVDPLIRRSGSGYLSSRMSKWCEIAEHQPLLLLTDLDQSRCAPSLIRAWLGRRPQPPQLIFRIAVREVEAWLLADHEAMHAFLGRTARLPKDPDAVADPKRYLLDLAKHAKRAVRDDLLASEGAIASQGLGYNTRLSAFVESEWDPHRAAVRSKSLQRALTRISDLALR